MRSRGTTFSWDTEHSEIVYRTHVFDLHKERSTCLRTGQSGDFYTFSCMDWVNVIAVTPDENIVMIRQYRHGSRQVELEIPGGCMNQGEAPEEAGARELLEETGYAGDIIGVIGKVCPNPALQGNDCFTVLVKNAVCRAKPDMDSTEDIETLVMPFADVMTHVNAGELTHGLVLNALQFYDLYRNSDTE